MHDEKPARGYTKPVSLASGGLPTPQRYWSVFAISLAVCMAVLDGAIANVALPTITKAVGTTPSEAIWVINGYQISIMMSLLPLATIGERVGYRTVYLVGLAVFVGASAGCALSGSLPVLIGWRVAQGFGAAGIMSMNGALLRFTYPRDSLGRGVGFNAVVVALSSALGPTIAAGILSVGSWEWLFAVNVPFGLAALLVGTRYLPYTQTEKRSLDGLSIGLNGAAMALLILGVDGLGRGEDPLIGSVELVIGIIAGAVLILRERKKPRPLVPVDLLKIRIFALSMATSIASFAAQMSAFVALPFTLENQLHRTAVETGFLMTPFPLGVAVVAPIAGRLADKLPAAILGSVGLAILSVGLVLMALVINNPTNADLVWRMALCGIGFALFQSPNNRVLLSSAPRERSGSAGGMLATARLLGQTIGAIFAAIFLRLLPNAAGHASLLTGAVLAGIASLISLSRSSRSVTSAA